MKQKEQKIQQKWKNKKKRIRLYEAAHYFFIGVVLLFSVKVMPTFAEGLLMTQLELTHNRIAASIKRPNTIKVRSVLWGLTIKEFKRYLWLMQNTPSGHWYRHLDPAEVLALNARDSQQMIHYAKIQARLMHARVTRELAFDRLYTAAYHDLYPNEQAVMTPGFHRLTSQILHSGDRIWLFVGLETPLARFAYQHLIKAVQAVPGTVLDIYFVGHQLSVQRIQAWATAVGITRTMVNQQVTLNIGNARFKTIAHGKAVNLPFVGIIHRHHFQPITLSSVL